MQNLIQCHAADETHACSHLYDADSGVTHFVFVHDHHIWTRGYPGVAPEDSPWLIPGTDVLPLYLVARLENGGAENHFREVVRAAMHLGALIPVYSEAWNTPESQAAGLRALPAVLTDRDLLAKVEPPAPPLPPQPLEFWTAQEAHPFAFPGAAAALLALLAVTDMPYAYYPFLRSAMMAAAVVLGIISVRSNRSWWLIMSGALFIFFAPANWIPLTREQWLPLDLITAAAFIVAACSIPGPKPALNDQGQTTPRLRGFTITLIVGIVIGGGMYSLAYGNNGAGGDPDCTVVQDTRGSYCE